MYLLSIIHNNDKLLFKNMKMKYRKTFRSFLYNNYNNCVYCSLLLRMS